MNLIARNVCAHKPIDIRYFRIVRDTEDERPRPASYASRAVAPELTL